MITDGDSLSSRGFGVKLENNKLLIDLSQSPDGGQLSNHHWQLKDFTVAIDTWYHATFVRNDNKLYAYINGIKYNFEGLGLVADQTDMEYLECGKLFKSNYLCIGGVTESNGTYNGYLQDIRISKKAVYTSCFDAPKTFQADVEPIPANEPSCGEVELNIQSDFKYHRICDVKSMCSNTQSFRFNIFKWYL